MRRISVIIPTLNAPLIADVVRAVHAQELPKATSLEVIVSGLDELGLVTGTNSRYVSLGKPLSAAAARNLGVTAATGDALVFLDADCIPDPGWLSVLLEHLRRDRVVVSGAIRLIPDRFYLLAGNLAAFHEFTSALPSSERPFLASFSLAVPRCAFDEVGGFLESFPGAGGEDLDFTIRLARKGYRLRFEPQATVTHHPSRASLRSLMYHAYLAGRNSIVVRRTYPEVFQMPVWLFCWPVLLACSPVLAGAVLARAVLRNEDVRANWKVLPVMFWSRVAWCLGACSRLRVDNEGSPKTSS